VRALPQVRVRTVEGGFQLSHVDELVDLMLSSDYMFDIALPRLPDRCGPCLSSAGGGWHAGSVCVGRSNTILLTRRGPKVGRRGVLRGKGKAERWQRTAAPLF
jgi:hypothetical protein